jgi:hypothetical protein
MFTFAGGYHLRGQDDTFDGIPLGQGGFMYAMIHELAHFTGPTGNGIDNAYFHKDSQRYRNLSPDLAFHNADCYSQFPFDAIGKPNFNVELTRI